MEGCFTVSWLLLFLGPAMAFFRGGLFPGCSVLNGRGEVGAMEKGGGWS
jgi:uncharacterized membrane protein YiaA